MLTYEVNLQLPFVQALIVNTVLDSGERGIAIILDAVSGGGQNPNKDNQTYEFPDVMKCAHSTKKRCSWFLQKLLVLSLPYPAALGIVWVIAGLAKEEDVLKHVWRSIRANNGIHVLLSLLRIREPASHAGTSPSHSQDPTCIVNKRKTPRSRLNPLPCLPGTSGHCSRSNDLSDPIKTAHYSSSARPNEVHPSSLCTLLQNGTSLDCSIGGYRDPILPDNINEHLQFKYYALDLINKIVGAFLTSFYAQLVHSYD